MFCLVLTKEYRFLASSEIVRTVPHTVAAAGCSAPMSSECSADVDHAEVRDPSGHNESQLTAPPGKLFGEVSFGGNRQVASLTARPKDNPDAPIALICEINQSGLIPMQPILTCDHCGAGSSFGFDNGHFLSLVLLKYDFANHSLSLAPIG